MRENTAIGGTGGAVGVWGNATVTAAGSCLVANNSAYGGAGFDLNDYSNTTLLEVMFVNNTVQGNGSGVYAGNYAQVVVDSCSFISNKADKFGGAVSLLWLSRAAIRASNFTSNSASIGAALAAHNNSTLELYGSHLQHNNASEDGGAVLVVENAQLTMHNSSFLANIAGNRAAVLTYQARYQVQRRAARKPVPVEAWPAGFVLELREKWQDILQLDLAQSTHRSYGWHVRQYRQFCVAAGAPQQPHAQVLAQFVVGRAQHGYAVSTIEQGVYAVARWALDVGQEGLASELVVRRAMKVAAKLAVPAGRQKLPLDRRELRAVVSSLQARGRRDFIGVRDAALFLLGWTGMFRSSELVGIDWDDLRPIQQKGGVLIYVPRSKTDQAGEGAWVFIA
ncbi:hypothetical protein OEZ86_011189 [Tetradesmus obliquus]|nr:hypothetical protein OEZ86_011189 [Tetradesmus obliquus]